MKPVLASLDGAEEELLALALAPRPAVALAAPLPELAAFARGEVGVSRPQGLGRRGALRA